MADLISVWSQALVHAMALAARLEREGQYNVTKLARAAADALARQAALAQEPAPGVWSLRNAVTHLRDAQGVLAYRLGLMLEQEDPELTTQAVFAWAQEEAANHPATDEVFAEYLTHRRALWGRLESLTLRQWYRTGRHQEFGPVTVLQQVSYFAAHEPTHLAQMAALTRAARPAD